MSRGVVAVGVAVAIARAAAIAGAEVELVGKVGSGTIGDAILLDLAASGVGHVAMLRDGMAAVVDHRDDPTGGMFDDDLGDSPSAFDGTVEPDIDRPTTSIGPVLDAADVELALRYLPDYGVVIVAEPLDAAALAAVGDAARWAGAQLVAVSAPGSGPGSLPEDATILEAPAHDATGAFATMVGRYAAALDAGEEPAAAFAKASKTAGWASVAD